MRHQKHADLSLATRGCGPKQNKVMNINQNMVYFCYCCNYYELLTYDQCVNSLSLMFD